MDASTKGHLVFDPIYGFIQLTPVEWEIIHSPFYQRLRWIKQLGFSSYVFHGAEHSRFGHSLGAMFNAHKILQSIGLAVDETRLRELRPDDSEARFHQGLRLAALMHDLGTFPFSHTTESSYLTFYKEVNRSKNKKRPFYQAHHEELGSIILTETNYPSGISYILNKFGLSPSELASLVKGSSDSLLANQILHSEIDCDRMDYLLRDAYYTGLKYGTYDRDYLLHHFQTISVGGQKVLGIKVNALHCVEDFLMARFAWYSQVIRSPRGAKFDAIGEELCSFMLKEGIIYHFEELVEMVKEDPMGFFGFNDSYFMDRLYRSWSQGQMDKDPRIKDMASMLLLERGPKNIQCEEFKKRLLDQDDAIVTQKVLKKAREKIAELESCIQKKGQEGDWLLVDIPKKDIVFVSSHKRIVKKQINQNLLLERDPVKIIFENGEVKLLGEVENSIISRLQSTFHFVPNVFCSQSAYSLLEQEELLE